MPADSGQLGTAADFGLKSFELAPAGFDPRASPDDILQRFGVLPRPSTDSSVQYRELWNRIYSRDLTFVAPRLKSRTPSRRNFNPSTGLRGVQYDNWAGIGIERADTPVTAVSGTWSVPNLDVPPYVKDGDPCINSVWVGIDGFSAPNSDILQAGVDLRVTRQAGILKVAIEPWWEWWKGQSFYFDNFPVSPGDIVACHINCVAGGTTGTVRMANLVSGLHISLLVPAPAGTTLIGNCAEWIVERQTFDATSSVLTELSEFGSIFLDDAFASTNDASKLLLAGKGVPISMVAVDNTTILASPTILGPTALKVERI